MIYKKFQDKELSALGLGMMRLPEKGGNIDEKETEAMIEYAMENGVNYYDTAWGYHNGQSELVTGKLLKKYKRESYYLATKFPGYDVSNMDKVEEIFEKQLEKCQTDYFDFYLFHNVCENNIEEYLDEKYGIYTYLLEQKRNGRIKHLGFSAHGSYDIMKRFLEAYGENMEFCQIQLNYLDWHFQEADKKVELLRSYHLPIWVMEPLRGGKLASLHEKDAKLLKSLRPEESIPGWAFRFLQTIPDVTMTLSGMSNMQQLKENIKTYTTDEPLTKKEFDAIVSMADAMVQSGVLPCTACRYCTTYCPQELDIPKLISLYNEHVFTGGGFLAPMVVGTMPEEKRPSACIGCKSCEEVCPQQIHIAEMMKNFTKLLQAE